MTLRNVTATLAGLVAVMASTTAIAVIWLVLTVPTTVAGTADGRATTALHIVVQAVYAVLSRLIQYL
jgi:hypothetical protein